ncbi:hypothetical protein NGA_0646400 [Nannochloropsis gaditana CCMP526]|uniref:uncharacterized protein n=1 Tax=Nannochloropsis gaditana (strain CCMP526) TaxID=1093141 RepID=UPI00029F706B|nr:hypothetical protein NGA_0646400 [Nannochloropsis gaditana CCMP526]EKU20715.1 hypothetical protein NGA_0646400 [Nannochloropsis gaditana CCMP526]|eukprot:XP_005855649.1 hypothetical protein NGA_0646400 [Nannochloropsis gaditana CCMP526]
MRWPPRLRTTSSFLFPSTVGPSFPILPSDPGRSLEAKLCGRRPLCCGYSRQPRWK